MLKYRCNSSFTLHVNGNRNWTGTGNDTFICCSFNCTGTRTGRGTGTVKTKRFPSPIPFPFPFSVPCSVNKPKEGWAVCTFSTWRKTVIHFSVKTGIVRNRSIFCFRRRSGNCSGTTVKFRFFFPTWLQKIRR